MSFTLILFIPYMIEPPLNGQHTQMDQQPPELDSNCLANQMTVSSGRGSKVHWPLVRDKILQLVLCLHLSQSESKILLHVKTAT
jgi:hypothetical protein